MLVEGCGGWWQKDASTLFLFQQCAILLLMVASGNIVHTSQHVSNLVACLWSAIVCMSLRCGDSVSVRRMCTLILFR